MRLRRFLFAAGLFVGGCAALPLDAPAAPDENAPRAIDTRLATRRAPQTLVWAPVTAGDTALTVQDAILFPADGWLIIGRGQPDEEIVSFVGHNDDEFTIDPPMRRAHPFRTTVTLLP